jgi:hypothetical protein
MTDQHDVADRLDAHDADELAVRLDPREGDAGGDLAVELGAAHVRLVEAVGRDRAAVGLRGGVDDREDGVALVLADRADRARRYATPSAGVVSSFVGSSSST